MLIELPEVDGFAKGVSAGVINQTVYAYKPENLSNDGRLYRAMQIEKVEHCPNYKSNKEAIVNRIVNEAAELWLNAIHVGENGQLGGVMQYYSRGVDIFEHWWYDREKSVFVKQWVSKKDGQIVGGIQQQEYSIRGFFYFAMLRAIRHTKAEEHTVENVHLSAETAEDRRSPRGQIMKVFKSVRRGLSREHAQILGMRLRKQTNGDIATNTGRGKRTVERKIAEIKNFLTKG